MKPIRTIKKTQDPSITVKLKLQDSNEYILIWTTTPWTLPANLAVAVGAEISYLKIKDKESSETWIVAEKR